MERRNNADYRMTVTRGNGNGNLYVLADLLKKLEKENNVPNYQSR
jgi:hypothetical protein